MFVQNLIKLSAAVHELLCWQKKTQWRCWKQYCPPFCGRAV